jgi:uroporphyrinogen decarboxylase
VEDSTAVINRLLRGGRAERIGLMDNTWPETVLAWVRQGYPRRRRFLGSGWQRWREEDGRWVKTEEAGEFEEPVPVWKQFDHDMVWAGGGFDCMPLRGYDELLEETEEWEIRRNGGGAALKYWKHRSGTPEHINFLMRNRKIWERDYRPHLLRWDPERLWNVEEARAGMAEARASGKWVYFGQTFVWENMRQMMGDVTLYESVLLDPGWIHDFNRVTTDLYQRYYRYIFQQVGKPDGIWMYEDLGYRNGLFASPAALSELIFPYYREMVEFFHDWDLPVVFHSCGSTVQALPMIVEAGFDALNPIERKAEGNDPFLFAEQYGDRLAFIGGLDVRILETNDHELIRREITRYLDGMKARGARLIFASDHSIPPGVSCETYRYMVEVYRERMIY